MNKDDIVAGIGFMGVGCLTLLLFLFIWIPICTLLSGLGSWIIGLFFGDLILGFLTHFGIHGFTMFQLGICFGFVGGFFKSSNFSTKRNK